MPALVLITSPQIVQGGGIVKPSYPPLLRNADAVIGPEDYPVEAIRNDQSGIVSILLGVSSKGRATTCDVTESTNSPSLDAKTCSLFVKRASFKPARDGLGAAVQGTFRIAISWGSDGPGPSTAFNLTLAVAQMPTDYQAPVKARLTFDPSGRVSDCGITKSSGSGTADNAICVFAKQQATIPPFKSGSTEVPAAAVRYLTGILSVKSAAAKSK